MRVTPDPHITIFNEKWSKWIKRGRKRDTPRRRNHPFEANPPSIRSWAWICGSRQWWLLWFHWTELTISSDSLTQIWEQSPFLFVISFLLHYSPSRLLEAWLLLPSALSPMLFSLTGLLSFWRLSWPLFYGWFSSKILYTTFLRTYSAVNCICSWSYAQYVILQTPWKSTPISVCMLWCTQKVWCPPTVSIYLDWPQDSNDSSKAPCIYLVVGNIICQIQRKDDMKFASKPTLFPVFVNHLWYGPEWQSIVNSTLACNYYMACKSFLNDITRIGTISLEKDYVRIRSHFESI